MLAFSEGFQHARVSSLKDTCEMKDCSSWLKVSMKLAGLNWTPEFGRNTEIFIDNLLGANSTTNIIGIKSREDIYRCLIFDSLMAWKIIPQNSNLRILDFGTGAGFPGVPMKLNFPEAKIIFLDSNGKKIRFIENIASIFKWKEAPVNGRLDKQNKITEFFEKYDIIIAKAVGSITELGSYLWQYLARGGTLIFFMGPRKEKEEILYYNKKLVGIIKEFSIPEIFYKRKFYLLTKEDLIGYFRPTVPYSLEQG